MKSCEVRETERFLPEARHRSPAGTAAREVLPLISFSGKSRSSRKSRPFRNVFSACVLSVSRPSRIVSTLLHFTHGRCKKERRQPEEAVAGKRNVRNRPVLGTSPFVTEQTEKCTQKSLYKYKISWYTYESVGIFNDLDSEKAVPASTVRFPIPN